MKVIVIGRSAEVWDEVAAAKRLTKFDKVVAVNVAGQDYPDPVILHQSQMTHEAGNGGQR